MDLAFGVLTKSHHFLRGQIGQLFQGLGDVQISCQEAGLLSISSTVG